MPFWSSQTLEHRLNDLVSPASVTAIDCNSITLTVGHEIYITPSLDSDASRSHTKKVLATAEPFAIPPGQFAFLLTEEIVSVPVDAMAFISMKATYKLKGLVNVSGFHVDPGWTGRLLFAVFNAGPSPVHLQRGLPLFLIWYADLDQKSEKHKTGKGSDIIQPSMINNITGAVDSLYALDTRLRESDKRLNDRIHEVEKSQKGITTTLYFLGALLLALLGHVVLSQLRPAAAVPVSTNVSAPVLQSQPSTVPTQPEPPVPAAAPSDSKKE